jgi:uncharacterized membrane protein YqiK
MFLTLSILVIVIVVLWLGSHFVIGITLIKSDEVGLVEKRFSHKGSLDKAIIALNGEAGYQPDVLRGGIHLRSRIQFRIHRAPLVTIPQGQIGYVFARDGLALSPQQTLGRFVAGNNFEDVRYFIEQGGQRGPQRAILREGTYAINLIQFVVLSEQRLYFLALDSNDKAIIERMGAQLAQIKGFRPIVIGGGGFNQITPLGEEPRSQVERWAGENAPEGADEPRRSEAECQADVVGIVTVHDGPSLPQGEIIAPLVGTDPAHEATFHNNFQDPEKFLAAGGQRGKQYQVLTDGTYFINRMFATVEFVPKTVIEIGWTGVVVSFFGEKGEDASGEEFRHGELVASGKRGVWQEPLMPGKYAFNTYAGRVEKVPVTNFVLKWISNEAGPHGFDQNLSEIGLITKDAFEPTLPLSVVIQIPYREAPLVIQRFGNIQRLVEQTLDPMVGSYFKNVGQRMTLIELIQKRSDIQDQSTAQMREKFARYNLRLEEVLIGTPHASQADQKIEQILSQLRDRQIADEQVITYERQQKAAEKEKDLNEARATALQQTQLTQSSIEISIAENSGKAEAVKAVQEAQKIMTLASADARKIQVTAEAQGVAEAKIGLGKAIAVSEQVKAYGGPGYQVAQDVMARIAEAIGQSGVPIVPATVISMGDGAADGGSAFSNLLGLLMTLTSSEKLGLKLGPAAETPERQAVIDEIKAQLLQKLTEQPEPAPTASAAVAAPAGTRPEAAATRKSAGGNGEAVAAAAVAVQVATPDTAAASAKVTATDTAAADAAGGGATAATSSTGGTAAKAPSRQAKNGAVSADGVDRWLAQNPPVMDGQAEPAPKKRPRPPKPSR